MSEAERKAQPAVEDMSIDIGASSREEVLRDFRVRMAAPVVPDVTFEYQEKHDLMIGKAFDCRLGCASILRTLDNLRDKTLNVDVTGAFAVQEEMGTRGATVTANTVKPDLAIVFEGCPADDTVAEPYMIQTAIHKGPMLRHIDARMITNPRFQRYALDLAEELGIPCAGGLYMLVAQAKAASERFQAKKLPDELVADITAKLERETKNILLIGMPGCGKTTIGKALAQKLGRPLADVDEKIIEEACCSIPHIFASEGEEGFRVREHRALAQIAKESGQVISAGGGIVTRPENRDRMEENSVVVWLRRDLDKLPTDGRPVSQSVPREELYRRRAPLYEAMAQVTADNNGTVEDTVDEIIRKVMG